MVRRVGYLLCMKDFVALPKPEKMCHPATFDRSAADRSVVE